MNGQRPSILAIDDNPQNLVVLATALDADFDFELAASGDQGLRLALENPPDLILLDVMMPEMDGFEVCRRLKETPELAAIPVVFLTALNDLAIEVRGLELGGADYITKPLNIELVKQRIRNILRLTQLTRELKKSEERLRLVMEATGEGIWDWDIPSGMVLHNRAWCRTLGLDDSFLNHPLSAFTERIHTDDQPQVELALQRCLSGDGVYASEHRLLTSDGHFIWVADRGKVVERDALGRPLRMVGSIKDIDERKRYEAKIHELAFFDVLTGLPNRRLLLDRLQSAVTRNQRRSEVGALMFLDMDRFKQLNDTHGHAKGDALLVEVAKRLSASVRAQDTVSRLGGDEFVVMLENVSETTDSALANALKVGNKILQALNEPYQLEDIVYPSTPSIGLTLFNGANDTVDGVLYRADMAMYQAKCAGRNCIKVFVE